MTPGKVFFKTKEEKSYKKLQVIISIKKNTLKRENHLSYQVRAADKEDESHTWSDKHLTVILVFDKTFPDNTSNCLPEHYVKALFRKIQADDVRKLQRYACVKHPAVRERER